MLSDGEHNDSMLTNTVSQIFHGVETALAWLVTHHVHGLANNGLTDAQRISLSPSSPEYIMR